MRPPYILLPWGRLREHILVSDRALVTTTFEFPRWSLTRASTVLDRRLFLTPKNCCRGIVCLIRSFFLRLVKTNILTQIDRHLSTEISIGMEMNQTNLHVTWLFNSVPQTLAYLLCIFRSTSFYLL